MRKEKIEHIKSHLIAPPYNKNDKGYLREPYCKMGQMVNGTWNWFFTDYIIKSSITEKELDLIIKENNL